MYKEIEVQTANGIRGINQESLFIVAEVGNQFNGDLETAKKLALVAKEAGADAVKYIFWFPDEIMAEDIPYTYETVGGLKTESMKGLLNKLRLPLHEWAEVKHYCDKIEIIMMSTVNCFGAYDYALDLGLPIIKLSSWDWNFTDLWRWCARTMLPCIADLGPVTEEEVKKNVDLFLEEKSKSLMFLHCTHGEKMNMSSISYLRDKFDCITGYSSSGRNDETDIMSIGLGACILEKRLTLDRKGGVLHDAISKEPDEFKDYVTQMRKLKSALGDYGINQSKEDWAERPKWFRRVVVNSPIGEGDPVLRHELECKRGETGFPPERIWEIVGKIAKHDMPANYDITLEDVE